MKHLRPAKCFQNKCFHISQSWLFVITVFQSTKAHLFYKLNLLTFKAGLLADRTLICTLKVKYELILSSCLNYVFILNYTKMKLDKQSKGVVYETPILSMFSMLSMKQ